MKKYFFLISFFFSCIASAQYIFISDHEFYSLLYLSSKIKVTIQTEFPKESYKGVFPSVHQYTYSGKKFYERVIATDSSVNHDIPIECSPFPQYVPLGNNKFFASLSASDSLIFDEKKRISEVHSRLVIPNSYGSTPGSKTIFTYLPDSSIMTVGTSEASDQAGVALYILDSKRNLVASKSTSMEKGVANHVVMDIVDWKTEEKFQYNKSRNRIESIQTFSLNGNKRILEKVQVFVYRNDRPASSFVRDFRTNKIVYRQTYSYSAMK